MHGNVVLGVSYAKFEKILEDKKQEMVVKLDTGLDGDALRELIQDYKAITKDFPQSPVDQLWGAISAVFESWNTLLTKDLELIRSELANEAFGIGVLRQCQNSDVDTQFETE